MRFPLVNDFLNSIRESKRKRLAEKGRFAWYPIKTAVQANHFTDDCITFRKYKYVWLERVYLYLDDFKYCYREYYVTSELKNALLEFGCWSN